jgi:F0F1-type ATP synthase assembly protein I
MHSARDSDDSAGDRSDSRDDRRTRHQDRIRARDSREKAAVDRHAAADAADVAEHELVTLRAGLEDRTVIGQAIGILMERHGLNTDRGFLMLATIAQQNNEKSNESARRIVALNNADAQPVLGAETKGHGV